MGFLKQTFHPIVTVRKLTRQRVFSSLASGATERIKAMKNIPGAIIVFAISIASLSLGNILLKMGMDRYATLTAAGMPMAQAVARVPLLPVGAVLMLVQFFCTLILFKWGWDASVVIPVMGICYFVMAVLAKYMLGEPVNAARWFGICLIILGVFFVARSGGPVKAG